jgi:DNA-binding transcriptional LysR family regulator
MKPDSLQGILPFASAVEAGSFTLAGRRLGVTTSAVGKSIAQLERRLGVRLLNRSTRSLSLTSEGEAYYKACVAALAEIDAAQALLAAHRQVPSGRVRVDLPLAFGRRCVAPILFEVISRYPQLALEVAFNDRRVNLIEEGVDLAIRIGRLGDSTGLIARRLFVQRSTLCATPGYLERHGRPANLDELSRHAAIVYGRDGSLSPWTLREPNGRSVVITPPARIVLGHGEPMLDAVLADLGIAYLPTWLAADHLRRGAITLVWPQYFIENELVHALWPKTRTLAPKVRVVVDALLERFAAPPWDRL